MKIIRIDNEKGLKLLNLYLCRPDNKYLTFVSTCQQDESFQKFFVDKNSKNYSFSQLKEIYLLEFYGDENEF